MQSLRVLFTERHASYRGEYISFENVESYPKPAQATLPLLSGGNAPASKRRAALFGTGWIPAVLTPEECAAGVAEIQATAAEAGRELPGDFDVAPQLSVSIGRTREEAWQRFERSQLYSHMRSLSSSTLKDQQGGWVERNLIGTPEDIAEQVHRYAEAGVTTLSALLFAANNVAETLDMMAEFAETVIAPYQARA
jgi:alkanesulfonate monooxygenase SsuD/methylene tetrahydromethanopterin reductase-like flavin-dependent oxidoreductase (luciferase family)